MAQVIVPGHQSLYTWHVTQLETSIQVILDLPDDIDANSISVDIIDESVCILICRIPNEIPFIAGKAFAPISGYELQFQNEFLILNFTKKSKGSWPCLIDGPVPGDTLLIDPFSAFSLAVIEMERVASLPEEEHAQGFYHAELLLQKGVESNFIPALSFKGRELVETGHVDEAKRLFLIAWDQYRDPDAATQLGSIAFHDHNFQEAERCFRMAADAGYIDAEICLGELYSPVEGEVSGLEDAEKAKRIFLDVLEKKPDHPFALYGLAKLYLHGCGVPRDIGRAKQLYQQARDICNGLALSIPEIKHDGINLADWTGPEVANKTWGFVAVPVVVVAIFGFIVALKFFKRKK